MCVHSLTIMIRSRPAFSVASRSQSILDNLMDAMRPAWGRYATPRDA
jgi:hypothetical protein